MNETVTVTLHGEPTTVVKSARYECEGQRFTSFEIGPVSIFASVELLRRIADEATKAALVAEGWAPPKEETAATPSPILTAPPLTPSPLATPIRLVPEPADVF